MSIEAPNFLELYKIYRQQIEKENDSVNQKVVWNMISQSFFFGAYVTMINAPQTIERPFLRDTYDLMLWMVPASAFVIASIMLLSLGESFIHISRVRSSFEEKVKMPDNLLPPLEKDQDLQTITKILPFSIPLIFVSVWGSILYQHLQR